MTEAQRRMAIYMGFSPNHRHSWPIDLINEMIALEQQEGIEAVYRQCRRMFDGVAV